MRRYDAVKEHARGIYHGVGTAARTKQLCKERCVKQSIPLLNLKEANNVLELTSKSNVMLQDL